MRNENSLNFPQLPIDIVLTDPMGKNDINSLSIGAEDHLQAATSTVDIEAGGEVYEHPKAPWSLPSRRSFHRIIVAQWVLIALLAIFNVFKHQLYDIQTPSSDSEPTAFSGLLYSPADSVVQYQVRELSFNHPTPYKGAGDRVDRAWNDLFNYSKVVIPETNAVRLAGKPDPLYPPSAGGPVYVIELDVFSQLHCLNDLRIFIHADEYNNSSEIPSSARLSWCIDSLRQSLMCTADINPMVYSRDPDTNEFELSDSNAYTCRDFGAIQQWAKEREMKDWMALEIEFDDREYW